MILDRLSELVSAALAAAADDGAVAGDDLPAPEFERPKRREHGDWATNVALVAARGRANPRAVAEAIVARLPGSELVAGVEVAGPGFINIRLARAWLHDVVRRACDPAAAFGRSDRGGGRRIDIEYVSANPTGPINVVSGRHAAVGDAVANLLAATGHDVAREFYVNDAGGQVLLFGDSVAARYLQRFGVAAEVPDNGYHGDYVADIAADIAAEVGDRYVGSSARERSDAMRAAAVATVLGAMRASLERFGTRFDVWFSEATLHERKVAEGIDRLRAGGWIYDGDGAVWFRSSALGDDKDRPVVRANGVPTYLAGDIAYMIDKFDRGFDHLIYVWGADHHGTVPRLLAAADALGYGRARVEVDIIQMVALVRGGEAVRASKRAGVVVPLDDLVAEVGVDAARYFFLMRSLDAPLEFDIELAKERAPENPVYYVQYAHARICSILRKAAAEGATPRPGVDDLNPLVHPAEDDLMRKLAAYEEVVVEAAHMRAPQKVCRYAEELAATFSSFYRDCRVVTEDEALTRARLALCTATRRVIADALGMLGVGAPERM